ncbi:MAG: MBL fold metallo-hydrolase [bacterium]|nr:MBL fold metallo-hydrolase [bacterium]
MNNIKFVSLISGSSGNASLISDGRTNLLIDCGGSGKCIQNALMEAGVAVGEIDAVLLTHEHSDHVKGVGVLSRRYGFPIYATEKTHSSIVKVGEINPDLKINVTPDNEFEIGSIRVLPFSIPHDAADPVGYSFSVNNNKYTIATDMGYISNSILDRLKGSKAIILESNHDVEMLRCGPYPFYLQQRILGQYGHLSNETASIAALALAESGTEHIMLGHLSEHNNLPEIAMLETNQRLTAAGINVGSDITLQVAQRHKITIMDI